MEDVLEQIVGDISKPGEQVTTVQQIGPQAFRMAGDLNIQSWYQFFRIRAQKERVNTLVRLASYVEFRGQIIAVRQPDIREDQDGNDRRQNQAAVTICSPQKIWHEALRFSSVCGRSRANSLRDRITSAYRAATPLRHKGEVRSGEVQKWEGGKGKGGG